MIWHAELIRIDLTDCPIAHHWRFALAGVEYEFAYLTPGEIPAELHDKLLISAMLRARIEKAN